MERTQDQYTDLLNETVNYYSEDTNRRAAEDGRCMYNTADGRHCALGRCLDQNKYHRAFENELANRITMKYNDVNKLEGNEQASLDDLLIDAYKGYNLSFWSELQQLHDNDINWEVNSLSKVGKALVEGMQQKINLNQY